MNGKLRVGVCNHTPPGQSASPACTLHPARSAPPNTPAQPQDTMPAIDGKWHRFTNATEIEISELFKENWDWEDRFVSAGTRSRVKRHALPPLPGTAPYQFFPMWAGGHRGLPQLRPTKSIYR